MTQTETQTVTDLLPHQPPMRLIEAVIAHDERQIWVSSHVHSALPFIGEAGLRACFGLEMVAQAAAAFLTLVSSDDGPPRQGMLIASRSFATRIAHYPPDCDLLVNAKLDSRLPSDGAGSALVKFSGSITVFRETATMPTALHELMRLDDSSVDTHASLSVYL